MNNVAIIAGNGILPQLIAQEIKKQGKRFVVIKIAEQDVSCEITKIDYEVKIGNISQLLQILDQENIKEITFAGGIKKPSFSELSVDKEGAKLLAKITSAKIFGDDNVLTVVTKFFAKKGFKLLATKDIIKNITIDKGVLSKKKPNTEILENIKIGQNFINKISKFDVGQSVVVQQRQIIAVEAIEGTDAMIKRCKNIGFTGERAVLVKASKKNQNKNVDLPSIGVQTIKNLHDVGFVGLAIEAKNSLVLEKEKVLNLVNQYDMILIGI
jgi:DUF1009 family protein